MKSFCKISQSIKVPQQPIGKIVLAMTRGEVHDMGKTVIKGLFLHHQYEVIDLGPVQSVETILKAIEEHQPTVLGLSAMLTSALGDMQDIAEGLSQAEITLPLLIGGAGTTLPHTACFIAPHYTTGLTVHVKDVQYCQDVIPQLHNAKFKEEIKQEYADVVQKYEQTTKLKTILSYVEAQEHALHVDWATTIIKEPSFLGVRVFEDYDLDDVLGCMDWTTLFMAYSMKGKFPSILKDKDIGEDAQKLYTDAQQFLQNVIDQKLLKASAVIGFFPANSVGDDIEIYHEDQTFILHTLRQQAQHSAGKPYYALSDFVAPKESEIKDYVGMFVVTAGLGLNKLVAQYEQQGDYYHMIMAKSMADILAESFAERLHQRVRTEFWGYAAEEALTMEEMFQCRFEGIRPAPGYPACPDHSEKPLLFELLKATPSIGVELTETFAMNPASSICGVYFSHPESKYFWIGSLGDDQLADYAQRKAVGLKEVKKELIFHVI